MYNSIPCTDEQLKAKELRILFSVEKEVAASNELFWKSAAFNHPA